MRAIHYVIIGAILLSVCSCRPHKPAQRQLGSLAQNILLDRENRYNGVFDRTSAAADDDIVIIGDDISVIQLVDDFISMDKMDNGTGLIDDDMLADFAGECFTGIIDTTNTPFVKFVNGRESELSGILVRHVLSAIDTVVHVSPYDLDGIGTKESAKIIIVADPCLTHYGLADADSLLKAFNCNIPIISPVDVMFEDLAQSEGDHATVGVMCSKELSATGIYSTRLKQAFKKHGKPDADCVVLPADPDGSMIKNFLDTYINTGFNKPLDAIVIDLTEADIETMRAELADLLSIMNAESMTYRKYISDDFVLMESYSAVIARCYSILRQTNMFSMRISNPVSSIYYNIPAPASSEGDYILIPGTYVQN
ncbi:MAG: hypothetical protein KBS67_01480 [Bacteroidales bacterium]|nr:hypothetical protein [Candidatus Cryptobacteroides equifaecalis]